MPTRSWTSPSLLIIEDVDLGQERKRDDEPTAAHSMFNLIGRRHASASTAVTSNIELSEWGNYLGNATVAGAILDRLAMHGMRIDISGPSYRKHIADERAKSSGTQPTLDEPHPLQAVSMPRPTMSRARIRPDLIRQIRSQSCAFVPHRFLRKGFLSALTPTETRLYLLLVQAADRNDLSFYSFERICGVLRQCLCNTNGGSNEEPRVDQIWSAAEGIRPSSLEPNTAPRYEILVGTAGALGWTMRPPWHEADAECSVFVEPIAIPWVFDLSLRRSWGLLRAVTRGLRSCGGQH